MHQNSLCSFGAGFLLFNMKLLIAADIFPPEKGGPATYLVHMARALAHERIEVSVVSLNPSSDTSAVDCSVYAVRWGFKPLRYLHYFFLLIVHSRDADIVYAMGPVNAGLPSLMAARLLGKKMVVKVVGDYAWEQGRTRFDVGDSMDDFQEKEVYRLPVRLLRAVERYVVRRADCVIVPSMYLSSIVRGWGAKESRVEVVYNAVEFTEPSAMDKPQGERWIVSVGRLTPWKGMDTLISLMPRILEAHPDVKLKIVGDGPMMELLCGQIRDLGLEHTVELTGDLSHQQTLSYMKASDVFVLNSGYEGLSHVLLEVLSCGRPVLASNICGNPEVVRHGENGYLFRYNDTDEIYTAVISVLDSGTDAFPLLRSNLYRAELFKKFSFTTMVMKTKKILERVSHS